MCQKSRMGVAIFCLAAIPWIVFARACTSQFVAWDDPDMVWQNDGLFPPTIAKVGVFWREPCIGLYTPVPYTAWSAIAAMERHNPPDMQHGALPFHLLNLLLHTAGGILVFLILRELTRHFWAAWIGAVVFLVHPLQVEPVTWVSGMNNVMCGVFSLGALWRYVLYAKTGSKQHLINATVFYAAALLSKPIGVVVPVMAGMIDLWMLRRPMKTVVKPIALWAALAVPIAIVARSVQPSYQLFRPPVWDRLIVAVDAVGFYLVKLLLPIHLTIDYERTPQWLMNHLAMAIPGYVVLLGAIILVWNKVWARVALVIMVVGLLPVLGLTIFDFQAYSTVADRYMYLPMLGVALGVAVVMDRAKGRAAWIVAGVVLSLLAARSFDQTGIWHDTESLAAQQLAYNPDSSTGHKILAHSLSQELHDQQAETEYRAAIAAILREGRIGDGAVWYNYGNLLMRQHRYAEAIENYRLALPRMSPPDQAFTYNNMGIAFYRAGDSASARQQFLAALRIAPNYGEAKNNLAVLDQH
jgi:protein O-mannosyl-transferase